MNTLEELYYGNINPNEKCFEKSSDYAKAIGAVANNEELLTGTLDGKEKEQFLELMDAQSDLLSITALESFIDGFRLGARLTLDTFVLEQKRVFKDIC